MTKCVAWLYAIVLAVSTLAVLGVGQRGFTDTHQQGAVSSRKYNDWPAILNSTVGYSIDGAQPHWPADGFAAPAFEWSGPWTS